MAIAFATITRTGLMLAVLLSITLGLSFAMAESLDQDTTMQVIAKVFTKWNTQTSILDDMLEGIQ